MSASTIADAFAPAIDLYRKDVMAMTWGHLAPKRNKVYRGHVTFALGCLGSDNLNPTVLELEFGDLDSSPWLYDSLIEMLQDLDGDAGSVYRWTGTVRNYKWNGALKKMALVG